MSEISDDDISCKPHYDKSQAHENTLSTNKDSGMASGMYQPSPSFPTPQYAHTAPPQSLHSVPPQSSHTVPSQSAYAVAPEIAYTVPQQSLYPGPRQSSHTVLSQTQQAGFAPDHPTVIYDVPQDRSIKATATKVFAILQLLIGFTSIVLGLSFLLIGIVNVRAFADNGPFGIAGIPPGIFIIANGIIGIFSSRNPNNGCLNGTNMAFFVFSSLLAVGNISCFSIALIVMQECTEGYDIDEWRWCTDKSTGVALSFLLLLVYVVEFFVALIGSIYTCLFYECCKQCCRGTSQGKVLSYPQHAHPHGFGTAPSMLPTQQQQQQHFRYNENNDHAAANPYVNQGYHTETMSSNDLPPSYDDHSRLI